MPVLHLLPPAATRGARLEGWYWRVADEAAGRAAAVLCGVCRPRRGAPWAVCAIAAHPGGVVRWGQVDGAAGDPAGFGAWAHPLLRGTAAALDARVGDAAVRLRLHAPVIAARSSIAFAAHLPGLPQYWHAHVVDATAEGELVVAGERWDLTGARVYAEKNWGPDFAADWWWGQGFLDPAVGVSFAGGRVGPGAPTAVTLRLGDRVHRLTTPLARMTVATAPGAWRVRAQGMRMTVEIEGEAGGDPHVLPVPHVEERRCAMRSAQHLAGRLHLVVREGRRLRFSGETSLAGLERGLPRAAPPA